MKLRARGGPLHGRLVDLVRWLPDGRALVSCDGESHVLEKGFYDIVVRKGDRAVTWTGSRGR